MAPFQFPFTWFENYQYCKYSRRPKIDPPRIDTFYGISRNFEKIKGREFDRLFENFFPFPSFSRYNSCHSKSISTFYVDQTVFYNK